MWTEDFYHKYILSFTYRFSYLHINQFKLTISANLLINQFRLTISVHLLIALFFGIKILIILMST